MPCDVLICPTCCVPTSVITLICLTCLPLYLNLGLLSVPCQIVLVYKASICNCYMLILLLGFICHPNMEVLDLLDFMHFS